MRPMFALVAGLALAAAAAAQDAGPPRFDVLYNPDLYKQDTPQDTVDVDPEGHRSRPVRLPGRPPARPGVRGRPAGRDASVLRARRRRADRGRDRGGADLTGADLENRVRDVGGRLNFRDLASRDPQEAGRRAGQPQGPAAVRPRRASSKPPATRRRRL